MYGSIRAHQTESRRQSASANNPSIYQINIELAQDEQCDAKLDASFKNLKRERKDGSEYMVKILVGDKCQNVALVNKTIDGKRVKRCSHHIALTGDSDHNGRRWA
jgi:hypothetical protein